MSSQKTTQTKSKKNPPPTNEYVNYDSQLGEWSQRMDEFKERAQELGAEAQSETSKRIEELEAKYKEATEKIKELKDKGLQAKDEMKIGFEKAWKELSQAFEAVKKTFH